MDIPVEMTKNELEKLADLRLLEARILFDNNAYQGAYYLCGYSIECALKACIAKSFKANEFPNKKLVNDSYVHNLDQLLKLSNLHPIFQIDKTANPDLEINWGIVKDWSEAYRYDFQIDQILAQELIDAVSNNQSGILQWVKRHW
ncbi:DNA-binding protein [uncultured Acinetobacter sp.]|uniref:DNA-binding protein n=1 Tax=uncultured Acinetobacter sp. TaxID=165433 RepID=UPI003748CA47